MLIFTADGLTGAIEFHTSRNPSVRYDGRVYSSMSGNVMQDIHVHPRDILSPINLADPDLGIHLVQNQAHIREVQVSRGWISIQFDRDARVSILGKQNVHYMYLFFARPPPVNSSSELYRVQLSASRPAE